MSLNVLEILKPLNFIVDESVLWSILSSGVIFIQNKISSRDYEFCLMSLESMYISETGKFTTKRDSNIRYNRSYVIPEVINLKEEWIKDDDQRKEAILLYSLGISLRYCSFSGIDHTRTCSDDLGTVIDKITDKNAAKRLTLIDVLRICNTKGKKFTKERSYKEILSMFFKSYNFQARTDNVTKMIRSMSQSNVQKRRPSLDYTRQLSVGNMDTELSSLANNGDLGHNGYHLNSSLDSVSNHHSNSNSLSSQSPSTSDNNITKGSLSSSNYENLILNAIDSQRNITEALEKVKARRKVLKSNGPVKSPAKNFLSQSLNNSSKEHLDNSNGILSQSHGPNLLPSFKEPLENSTIERLAGQRNILGPEFVIRSSEAFNVAYNTQKRNSIFSRTESGRLIRNDVMVHLLNGVVLFIRNLNSKSTCSQIISAIHQSMPDLEFVTYGLCFALDAEFFFLNEEVNVYKLINYISNKSGQARLDNKINSNSGIHLFYRLKYYPTMESYKEMNAFDRRLLYLQLRQDLLNRNLPPLTASEALKLAGAAIQTEFGDNSDNLQENLEYLRMENYFHISFIQRFNIADGKSDFLRKQQSAWLSLNWFESESAFIEKVISNKYYGYHWYKANKNQLSVAGVVGKETFLLIDRHCIQMIDVSNSKTEFQIYKHFNYKWKQIDSISIKQKKIMIQPKMTLKVAGMKSGSYFPCFLDSRTKAQYIVRLCNDHHLIASQDDDDDGTSRREVCNDTGSHLRLSMNDYPVSLKQSIDFDDDDIFVDYPSSEDDACDSSCVLTGNEQTSSKHRRDNFKSLEGMNANGEPLPSMNGHSTSDLEENQIFNFRYADLDRLRHVSDIDRDILNGSESDIQSPMTSDNRKLDDINPINIFKVEIHKSKNKSIGLGIIRVKIKDIQGIFIKNFVENSIAANCNQLAVGDEIISINNQPVSYMTQAEVGEVMQNCGDDITLLIRRHNIHDSKVTSIQSCPANISEPMTKYDCYSQSDVLSTPVLKIDSNIQNVLSSEGALENLRTNYRSIVIPPMNLDETDQPLKRKIETFAAKEIKSYQEKLQWNIRNKNIVNGSAGRIYDLKINLNDLLCHKLDSKINVTFTMVYVQPEECSNDLFWHRMSSNNSRLVITLGSKDMSKFLYQNKEVSDKRFFVTVKEKCDITNTIAVRRLNVSNSSDILIEKIFQIQFCEWFNPKTSKDILMQIANLSCIFHQNLPNDGSIVIAYDDPSNKPTDFIVLFITVLLSLHCELPFHPVIRNQTLVKLIYSQINQKSKELLPSEPQFNSCISTLKLLLPFGDRCKSSSDISDID